MMERGIERVESGAWHAIARTLSVVMVIGIVGGGYLVGYNQGKTKGYSLASKDRATQSYEAQSQTVANVYNYAKADDFCLLRLWRLKLVSIEANNSAIPKVTQTAKETPEKKK